MAKKQRLDKAISMQGNLSRSEVKTLIRKGAVTVNGQVVKAADYQAREVKNMETGAVQPLSLIHI